MKSHNGIATKRQSTPRRSNRCLWQSDAGVRVPHHVPCAWGRSCNVRPHDGTGYENPVAGQQRNPAVRVGRRLHVASILSCEGQGVSSDKFGIQGRLAIFQQHGDHLTQVIAQLVERLSLRVCARKPRDIADQKPSRIIPLNDSLKIHFHNVIRISQKDTKRQAEKRHAYPTFFENV